MHNSQKKIKYKKKKRSFVLSMFFSRFFIIAFLIIVQFVALLYFINFFKDNINVWITSIITIIFVILIINSNKLKESYKIYWLAIIGIFPYSGALLFALYILQNRFSKLDKRLELILKETSKYTVNNINEYKQLIDDKEHHNIYSYLINWCHFNPFVSNEENKYYNNGNDYYKDVINELKKAKKFIFIESFLIYDGIIWREILEILEEKVKQGVEVKILYDGVNIISSFSVVYNKKLREKGIDIKIFYPIIPLLLTTQNHRNHRKFFIIDNEVAFTGGINIGDEYANIYNKFGIWKDSGIKIVGDSVKQLTLFFLQLWYLNNHKVIREYDKYLQSDILNADSVYYKTSTNELTCSGDLSEPVDSFSYIIPICDMPDDKEDVSEQLIKILINSALSYIYIMTPYIVITESMVDTMIRAVKRGVDVRIITPHIPDKKIVFAVTRSYYEELINNGIKIYEYKDGFCHSKVVLQDDKRAFVGTVNLDYRSLYLQYEDGIYLYKDKIIKDIKNDFNNMFNKCICIKNIKEIPIIQRTIGKLLKIVSSQL